MTCRDAIDWLRSQANEECRAGMARFGIASEGTLGVKVPVLRAEARAIGKDHALALELYRSNIHEAKILASMIARADRLRPAEMDEWVAGFDSWDVCDQCCMNLFRHTAYAYDKVREYAASERLFTRRAGYALLATLASGDKRTDDAVFAAFLPLVEAGASDERDAIKKAVNWALRQIGKRSPLLLEEARSVAGRLAAAQGRSARWIGRDAVRELHERRIVERVMQRAGKR